MDAETRTAFEQMETRVMGALKEFKDDMGNRFDKIDNAKYLPKEDCERVQEGCQKRFEKMESAVGRINATVLKASGAVAALAFLAGLLVKLIK